MEIYDFSVAPGAVREIHCEGVYVYFYAGSAGGADATIALKHDASGERVLLLPGQAFRIEGGAKARRWIVGNHAGAGTIAGRLVIGTGRIDDNRITGSVEVIDGGKARSIAGAAFIGTGYQAATAAVYSGVQLWNPAGSGKNLVLKALAVVSQTGNWTAGIQHATAKLTNTLNTYAPKKRDMPAGVGLIAVQTAGAPPGTTVFSLSGIASQTEQFAFSEPVVIPPDSGLSCWIVTTVNMANQSSFEWFEESI